MNDTLSKFLIFAAGAAIGSAVTWKLLKDKYERIAQEEIESVKEVFLGSQTDEEGEDDSEEEEEKDAFARARKPDINEYAAKLQAMEYVDYANTDKTKPEVKIEIIDEDERERPYVISPDEFDEAGYEIASYTYYADGVLTDDRGNVVKNVEGILGIDPEEHFGEYEEDSVFVRDDVNRVDYEILRDLSNYWGAE